MVEDEDTEYWTFLYSTECFYIFCIHFTHQDIFCSFLFKNPGNDATPATIIKLQTIWKFSKSLTDTSSERTLPAFTHMQLYGISPKNAVAANVLIGIPRMGDVTFINQLGETGTSLNESKKYGSLS